MSTDHVARNFVQSRDFPALRLGRKEKISEEIYPIALDVILEKDFVLKKLSEELEYLFNKLKNTRHKPKRREIKDEIGKIE